MLEKPGTQNGNGKFRMIDMYRGLPYAKGTNEHLPKDDVSDKRLIPVYNPATATIIGYTGNGTPDIDNMENLGHAAQHIWHYNVGEQEKEEIFRVIIREFEHYRGLLARTMVIEGGKLWRWADAEVQEAIDTLWHYHGEISRCHTGDGFARCQMPHKNGFSVRQPYGLILGITPWNFPLAVPMWKICGALAGGNAIIIKDSKETPFTLTIATELIQRAISAVVGSSRADGLLPIVQLVHGRGELVGKYLLEYLEYDKVAFTGSAETGRIVAETAGRRLKPCHLELGGHAAMVVLDDFDIDLAVAEAINANLGDSGQRCVSTRVVFVQSSRYAEFVEKYVDAARQRRIGNPLDQQNDMGPLISNTQFARVMVQVFQTTEQLRRRPAYTGDAPKEGYFMPPVVFTDVPYGVCAMDEEIFGPVIVINPLPGRTREEAFGHAVALVNQSSCGLSNALLTNDRRLASRAPWYFKTGLLYIGRGTTGAELNRFFGGVKQSGWGKEGKGLDDWTVITQVYDDYFGALRMAQAGAAETAFREISNARSPLG